VRRLALVAVFAALSLVAWTSSAAAAVTIGQLAPGSPPNLSCSAPTDYLQQFVTSGNSYVAPATGTITSWSHNASNATDPQTLTMKVYRLVGGLTYRVVGHDGPHDLNEGNLNTFAASVAVKTGDVLGFHSGSDSEKACQFPAPGQILTRLGGNLADGEQGTFSPFPNARINIAAVLVPTNAFTLGDVDRNKNKGIAKLTVNIPNAGELNLFGKGLKRRDVSAGAPGDVVLRIKAKKNKLDRLNENGKVKVKPRISFTPTGGDPSTQSRKLKLKKND
jgi:hypothetical protein